MKLILTCIYAAKTKKDINIYDLQFETNKRESSIYVITRVP